MFQPFPLSRLLKQFEHQNLVSVFRVKELFKAISSELRSAVANELIIGAAQVGHADIIKLLVDLHGGDLEVIDSHRSVLGSPCVVSDKDLSQV